ncbi:MAG: hypothetical protein HY696_02955 [Deltaproteobacteria bacterium]|nr:hypothetical protein [Deltaproteobacteria bacterium]
MGLFFLLTGCGGTSESGARAGISVGNGEPATVTNTVANPAAMQPGDLYQLTFKGGASAAIDLSGASDDAEYALAVMNLGVRGAAAQVQLVGNESAIPVAAKGTAADLNASIPDVAAEVEDWDLQGVFDAQLRLWETAMEREPLDDSPALLSKAAGTRSDYVVGDERAFRVISNLNSVSQYAEPTGEVRCVGDNVVFFVDTAVSRRSAALTDADIETLCRRFDRQLEKEVGLFGAPSDINDDGKVSVFLTPQVNRLGASGGGIITGFFFANDLLARAERNPVSNEQEIIYLLVPDPDGDYGVPIGRDLALQNLIPAVLVHELQHAINYNQHVLAGEGAPEESWLNEGLSHLAEDLLGMGMENPSRYALYLERTAGNPIVTPTSPGLVARGGIFLFLRYLYEQVGNRQEFVWELLHGSESGVANLEAAVGSTNDGFDQFAEFMMRWSATLALNDTGLTKDARYQYAERAWDAEQGLFSGVCTICAAEDFRGTELAGVQPLLYTGHSTAQLAPAAVQYYVVTGAQQRVTLWAGGSGEFGAVLIRTK